MRLRITGYQAWTGEAKAWLLLILVTFVLAGCVNTSTTFTGDALTEFEHSSRAPQEPKGR